MFHGDGYAGVWLPEPTCVRRILACISFVARADTAHMCWIASAAQEDDLGQVYLTNVDFLKNGIPASIIATAVRIPCTRCKSGVQAILNG